MKNNIELKIISDSYENSNSQCIKSQWIKSQLEINDAMIEYLIHANVLRN